MRSGTQWTPTVIIADPRGAERYRFQVQFGLAKEAFAANDFARAEPLFREIVDEHPQADIAPEALYWAGVSKYKRTGDAAALGETAAAFQSRYTDSVWAKKSSVWR